MLGAAGVIVVVLRKRTVRLAELRDERNPLPDPIFRHLIWTIEHPEWNELGRRERLSVKSERQQTA
jgi:hypothetical protein